MIAEEQKREDRIRRKVRGRLMHEITAATSHGGRYTSKDYRAYVARLRDVHVPRERTANVVPGSPEAMQQLGAAMAEMLMDTASRPGLMRRIGTPNDPSVVAWREELAEIDKRVNSVMTTVLPYSRHLNYPSKSV